MEGKKTEDGLDTRKGCEKLPGRFVQHTYRPLLLCLRSRADVMVSLDRAQVTTPVVVNWDVDAATANGIRDDPGANR